MRFIDSSTVFDKLALSWPIRERITLNLLDNFPEPVLLTVPKTHNSDLCIEVWVEDEIDTWMLEQTNKRKKHTPSTDITIQMVLDRFSSEELFELSKRAAIYAAFDEPKTLTRGSNNVETKEETWALERALETKTRESIKCANQLIKQAKLELRRTTT
jgi:hypothetical protein